MRLNSDTRLSLPRLPFSRALDTKRRSSLMPSSLMRDSAVRTIFVCCSSGSKQITLSLCAASQTAFSVSSNAGTTLVWRTIAIVEAGEVVVNVGDGVLSRGVVSGLNGRLGKLPVAASSSLSPSLLLLRLFGRSPGVGQSQSLQVFKGRFLLSL
jgi:hypothetical protein